MTLFGALVGGGVGFASHCLSNSIQKVPLSRRKWHESVVTRDAATNLESLLEMPNITIFRAVEARRYVHNWSMGR